MKIYPTHFLTLKININIMIIVCQSLVIFPKCHCYNMGKLFNLNKKSVTLIHRI